MKQATTQIANLYFDGKDFVKIVLQPNAILTMETIVEQYVVSHELTGGIPVRLLIDIQELKLSEIPKPVMEYMAKNEYNQYQKCVAVVIEGIAQKILGNIYLKIFKPVVNTRIFSNSEDAIAWLETAVPLKSF